MHALAGDQPIHPLSIPIGTVISSLVPIFTRHVGIISDRTYGGAPMVISNSKVKKGVVEESWAEWEDGTWEPARVIGYLGELPPGEVLRRARSRLGEKWELGWNCEHFVAWCHGISPRSPQLENLVAVSGLGLLLAKLVR